MWNPGKLQVIPGGFLPPRAPQESFKLPML
jgi:hypothetical protein